MTSVVSAWRVWKCLLQQDDWECRRPDRSKTQKALTVKRPHVWSTAQPLFDDEKLVSCPGLAPVMALAEQAGPSELLKERSRFDSVRVASAGVNPAGKVTTIIAGMAAGADSIDDLQVVRSGGDAVGGERLHGREDVVPSLGPLTIDVELPEAGMAEHLTVGAQGLLEDPAPVGDEQEARKGRCVRGQTPVVDRGDNGLAGSGGRDHQVVVTVVDDALDLELVRHLLLVCIRTHLEPRQGEGDAVVGPSAGGLGERVIQPVAVRIGIVGLKGGVVPVAVERCAELLQQGRGGDGG